MGKLVTPEGKLVDGKILQPLGGDMRDGADWERLRHSLDQHKGFPVNNSRNPVPLFKNRWGRDTWLEGTFEGATLFMVCGGPSTKSMYDLRKLTQPGIVTMGINNSPRAVRPNLWIEVDSPTNFMKSIWLDPKIMKFCPICHTNKTIFDNVAWKMSKTTVGECPNVHYYRRNEDFKEAQFLWEDTVNWGNHSDRCDCGHWRKDKKWCKKHKTEREKKCAGCGRSDGWGSRSVMLAAVRVAFALGFKTVFLVGADFRMEVGKPNYGWEQDRSKQSVRNNNNTYAALNKRFARLRPMLEAGGCTFFNCNEKSGLKAFDHIPFEEAIEHARGQMPPVKWNAERGLWYCVERTEGLYDREANERAAKKKPKAKAPQPATTPVAKTSTAGVALADLRKAVKHVKG